MAPAHKIGELRRLNQWRVGVTGVKGVDGNTLNVGAIGGGGAANVVADRAHALVNVRSWTADGLAQLKESVAQVMSRPYLKDTVGFVAGESSAFPPLEAGDGTMGLYRYYSGVARLLSVPTAADRKGGAADSAIAAEAGAETTICPLLSLAIFCFL